MLRSDKERIVGELTERLQATETLIVADYRGLTMKEVDALRGELLQHGAQVHRRQELAHAACRRGGRCRHGARAARRARRRSPSSRRTAIPVAVAKALADAARTTKVLAVRGGLLEGRVMTAEEVEELAKLPPLDVLRGQVLGAVAAPLYAIVGLFTAPLQDLHGLLQARIDQLGGEEAEAVEEDGQEKRRDEPAAEASVEEEEETEAPAAEASAEEDTDEETTEAAEEPAEAESEE